MVKLLQFSQGHPKPAFSEKVQRGDQRKCLKNRQKSSPHFKSLEGLAQMALSSNQNALKVERLHKILGQKSGFKSARMAKLLQFLQGHPKPAFSKKVQREDQGIFFKNRPKSSFRLKGPNTLAQMSLSSNQDALKVQRLEKILGQKSGSKSSLIAKLFQFLQGHPKPAFSEKVEKGSKENVSKKSPKDQPSFEKLKSTGANGIIL